MMLLEESRRILKRKKISKILLYEQIDFEDGTNNGKKGERKRTPITRNRQRLKLSVQFCKNTNMTLQKVENNEKILTIITVNDKITFIALSKKRKIDDNAKKLKKSSSIICGLEFVEEMELITQPLLTSKKFSETDSCVNTSIDGGDVSTVDHDLSIVHKTNTDESVDGDNTELEIDVVFDSLNTSKTNSVTQNDNEATSRRKMIINLNIYILKKKSSTI